MPDWLFTIIVLLIFTAIGWMVGYAMKSKGEIVMTTREYNEAINKAYFEGHKMGYYTGKQEALFARFTPNEIREAFGVKPIEEEK